MKIKRFEDIEAWQEARNLVNMVYKAINESEKFQKDFRLVNQIQDAAVSAMRNIAEGFSRRGNREFIQYLFISKSSAAEAQSQFMWHLIRDILPKKSSERFMSKLKKYQKWIPASLNISILNSRDPNNPNNPSNSINPINPNNSTNLYPACPVGQADRTGVKRARYLTGATNPTNPGNLNGTLDIR